MELKVLEGVKNSSLRRRMALYRIQFSRQIVGMEANFPTQVMKQWTFQLQSNGHVTNFVFN